MTFLFAYNWFMFQILYNLTKFCYNHMIRKMLFFSSCENKGNSNAAVVAWDCKWKWVQFYEGWHRAMALRFWGGLLGTFPFYDTNSPCLWILPRKPCVKTYACENETIRNSRESGERERGEIFCLSRCSPEMRGHEVGDGQAGLWELIFFHCFGKHDYEKGSTSAWLNWYTTHPAAQITRFWYNCCSGTKGSVHLVGMNVLSALCTPTVTSQHPSDVGMIRSPFTD